MNTVELPKLKPNRYDVVLHKDGYQQEVVFSGTKEECRALLKEINKRLGVWYHSPINGKDTKFLRGGYMLTAEYSKNQEPRINIKKPPRGGSGLK